MKIRAWKRCQQWLVGLALAVGLTTTQAAADGGDGQPEAAADGTMTILDASRLPSAGAANARPVRIRGVVTWRWQEWLAHCIVQDETGGIWINIASAREQKICADSRADVEAIGVGDEVEIEGTLERGGYAPNVLPITIRKVGRRPLPEPIPVDDARFFSGCDNLCRIVVEGVVQGVREDGERWLLLMERSSRPFVARLPRTSASDPAATLVNARVRLTGVAGAMYNTRGQYMHPSMLVGASADVEIVRPAPADPFEVGITPLEELAHFSPTPATGHRIRTAGIVSYARPGECFYLQEGSTGIRVAVRSREVPSPGDRVEVAGFLDRSRDFAGLAEAVYRVVGRAHPPDPRRLSPAQIIEISSTARKNGQMAEPGDFDGCLIRFPARLVDARQTPDGGLLTLDSDGERVAARLSRDQARQLPALEPGCMLDVTGILQLDLGDFYRTRPAGTAGGSQAVIEGLTLLVPRAVDVRILERAPWWNTRRLLIALGGVAAVLLGSLSWVGQLRRQVAMQATRLAGEMRKRREAAVEFQASLRERNRLAANLHDTLLQTLGGAGFQLDTCRRAVAREDLDETSEHLEVARRMLRHAVGELRGSVWALKTMPLAGRSFTEAVDAVVAQLRTGQAATIELTIEGEEIDLPRFVQGNLLLVVQEAVRNALQHGRPGRIAVHVAQDAAARTVVVTVRDDGLGFVLAEVDGPAQGHFGLQGMRERIAGLGGAFTVDSRPGAGTTIIALVTSPDWDRQLEEA